MSRRRPTQPSAIVQDGRGRTPATVNERRDWDRAPQASGADASPHRPPAPPDSPDYGGPLGHCRRTATGGNARADPSVDRPGRRVGPTRRHGPAGGPNQPRGRPRRWTASVGVGLWRNTSVLVLYRCDVIFHPPYGLRNRSNCRQLSPSRVGDPAPSVTVSGATTPTTRVARVETRPAVAGPWNRFTPGRDRL